MRTRSPSRSLDRVCRKTAGAVEGAAFWASIALPVAYPPLLAAVALSEIGPTALTAVVAANVLVLVVGHGYAPDTETNAAAPSARRSPDEEVAE